MQSFNTHKGLQKPLVFKSFKGKYIYWGAACFLGGFILCVVGVTTIGVWFGSGIFVSVVIGGLLFIGHKQKKGLHSKTKSKGIYILGSSYKFRNNVN
jgi:hypothetical protein